VPPAPMIGMLTNPGRPALTTSDPCNTALAGYFVAVGYYFYSIGVAMRAMTAGNIAQVILSGAALGVAGLSVHDNCGGNGR
jgi:hypothetical protein